MFLVFFITIFSFFSCNDDSVKKQKKNDYPPAGKTIKDSKIVTINKPQNIGGTKYSYNNLNFYLDSSFTQKDDKNYFGEHGINITIDKDATSLSLKDYSLFVFNTIQKEYPRFTLFAEENIFLNSMNSFKTTYILDKVKYLIQIESVLLKSSGEVYIFTITGKKQDIEESRDKIDNIFSTLEIEKI